MGLNNMLMLPDELGNLTLNELLNHPETEVVKKGVKLSLRRHTPDGVITLDITSYPSYIDPKTRKGDYTNDIIRMKEEEGLSQKDIASILGISESYISMIIRSNKRA